MDFTLAELQDVLAELGYRNVPPDQLREFEKDLRRLIKHDEIMKKKSEKIIQKSHRTERASPAESVVSQAASGSELTSNERPRKPIQMRDFSRESNAKREKLRTDPVRLYHWYKTFWDAHNLKKL